MLIYPIYESVVLDAYIVLSMEIKEVVLFYVQLLERRLQLFTLIGACLLILHIRELVAVGGSLKGGAYPSHQRADLLGYGLAENEAVPYGHGGEQRPRHQHAYLQLIRRYELEFIVLVYVPLVIGGGGKIAARLQSNAYESALSVGQSRYDISYRVHMIDALLIAAEQIDVLQAGKTLCRNYICVALFVQYYHRGLWMKAAHVETQPLVPSDHRHHIRTEGEHVVTVVENVLHVFPWNYADTS